MPCLLGILAFFAPRVVLALLFVFTHFLGRAYDGLLWPTLGFFFMPFTTLAYAAAMNWNLGSVSGFYFAVVLLAVLVDTGIVGGGMRHRQALFGVSP